MFNVRRTGLPVVFALAGLWGVADAIWQTQINALYGVLFSSDEEAAFSNYRLWESFGFFLGFITQVKTTIKYGGHLVLDSIETSFSQALGVCVFPKLILTIIFLGLGMSGYLIVEVMEHKKSRKN